MLGTGMSEAAEDKSCTDTLIAAYKRDGFVNGGKLLSDDDVAGLNEDLERFADAIVRGKPAQMPVPKATQWGQNHFQILSVRASSPLFDRAVHCAPMARIAAALAKTSLIQLWSDTVHYKAPQSGGMVNWHQDGPYYWGVRPVRRTISAWIALDDVDEESGCMWMAPGSWRWGRQEAYLQTIKHSETPVAFHALTPPANVPEQEWRGLTPCPVRRGEVHFHHPFTWHGSPANRTNRPRRAYSLFLLTGDCRAAEKNGDGLPAGAPMRRLERLPILYRA
jgi:phytanoyl-CoA hydroxylase